MSYSGIELPKCLRTKIIHQTQHGWLLVSLPLLPDSLKKHTYTYYKTKKKNPQCLPIDSSKGNHTLLLADYIQKEPACSLTPKPFTSQQTKTHADTRKTHTNTPLSSSMGAQQDLEDN